jgi:hypothetical protein
MIPAQKPLSMISQTMFDAEDKDIDLDEELDEDELDLEDEDLDEELDDESDEDESDDEEEDKDEDEGDSKKDEDYKKKFLRERAMRKRAESKLKSSDKKESPAPAKKTVTKKDEDARSADERIDFRLDNPQLKSKEVEHIERLAQAYNITMREAAKHPAVKTWLAERQKKRRLLAASANGTVASKGSLQKGKVNFETMTQAEFTQYMREREGRA